MPTFECDVCIIGGGISAALLAQKLASSGRGTSIIVVEAGDRLFDTKKRLLDRQRSLALRREPVARRRHRGSGGGGRHLANDGRRRIGAALGRRDAIASREEDLRLKSMYGLAADWPIEWAELERFYCEAERRIGVSGEPGRYPEDRRSEPYPDGGDAALVEPAAVEGVGREERRSVLGDAAGEEHRRRTTAAATASAATPARSVRPARATRPTRRSAACSLPRRSSCTTARSSGGSCRRRAAARRRASSPPTRGIAIGRTIRSNTARGLFVVAAGYCWSPHLLLASASSRFPDGLANSSGLVGRYMNGHAFISAQIELDAEIYPGMNDQHSLISRQFFRCATDKPFVRHDLRIWESAPAASRG